MAATFTARSIAASALFSLPPPRRDYHRRRNDSLHHGRHRRHHQHPLFLGATEKLELCARATRCGGGLGLRSCAEMVFLEADLGVCAANCTRLEHGVRRTIMALHSGGVFLSIWLSPQESEPCVRAQLSSARALRGRWRSCGACRHPSVHASPIPIPIPTSTFPTPGFFCPAQGTRQRMNMNTTVIVRTFRRARN
jgi:hypothetical protein